jgi:hypothetical protein
MFLTLFVLLRRDSGRRVWSFMTSSRISSSVILLRWLDIFSSIPKSKLRITSSFKLYQEVCSSSEDENGKPKLQSVSFGARGGKIRNKLVKQPRGLVWKEGCASRLFILKVQRPQGPICSLPFSVFLCFIIFLEWDRLVSTVHGPQQGQWWEKALFF